MRDGKTRQGGGKFGRRLHGMAPANPVIHGLGAWWIRTPWGVPTIKTLVRPTKRPVSTIPGTWLRAISNSRGCSIRARCTSTIRFPASVLNDTPFRSRSTTRLFWEVGAFTNLRLLGVVLVSGLVQLGLHHIPFAQTLLGTGPLSASDCALSIALGLIPVSVLECSKVIRRRTSRYFFDFSM